jgi:hypothetical protein
MVRDGSSGKDDKLPGDPADAGAAGPDDRPPPDVPSQLTQELARLLAASIAQSQGGKGFPLGVPTGSELASLASLVSAASGQRTLAPVFKDGLSALSYGSPHGRSSAILSPPAPEPPPPDDEPMPIPSTWRQPGSYDDDRWFRQQLGATLLGLFAGLVIVVPAVLWLSGWIGPLKSKSTSPGPTKTASVIARPAEDKIESRIPARPVEAAPQAATQYVTGSVDSRGNLEMRKTEPAAAPPVVVPVPAAQPAPPAQPAPKIDEQRARMQRMEELIAQAMQRAEAGDVMGAREILAVAEGGAPGGPITFALAETYDPNKLAAWGTRGVAADAVKARALYTKALNLGMTRAQERLDALK